MLNMGLYDKLTLCVLLSPPVILCGNHASLTSLLPSQGVMTTSTDTRYTHQNKHAKPTTVLTRVLQSERQLKENF